MDLIKQKELETLANVRNNLQRLMDEHGLKTMDFCNYIRTQNEPSMDRTSFLKFMSGKTKHINLAFLISCSHAFEVPLDNLVREDFDPKENFQKIQEKYKDISRIECNPQTFHPDDLHNNIFIENPNSPYLKEYMQTYYCYYYSTVSTENSTENVQGSLMSGELEFEPDGEKCKATLRINTKKPDENGECQYKIYSGNVILCPSIQSIHCILTLPKGEFCFIIFRYSHLNYTKQECRLAEVLSTSSIPDKRFPIVHRMLLSNQEIKEKDFTTIAPHLCLNSADIFISKSELLALSKESDNYKLIVEEILKKDSEPMYCIKEKAIKEIFEKYSDSEELPAFITNFRSHSLAKRYNKVSIKADEAIRNTLLQKGYFQK